MRRAKAPFFYYISYMPYVVESLPNASRSKPYYRITIRGTNRIVAKATPDPKKVIAAIELNKKRK